MSYPSTIDSPTNPSANNTLNTPSHSGIETAQNTSIVSIETKVGVDNSAVTSTIDYLLKSPSSTSPGHKHVPADVGLPNVTNDAQIKASIGTTKGDIIGFSASATPIRLGVGTDGQGLVADSAQTSGLRWATPGQNLLSTVTSDQSTSSTTEKTIITFSIPGGTLGTTNVLRIKFHFSESASSNLINGNFKLTYGATTLINLNLVGGSSTNNSFYGTCEAVLYAAGATGSQYGSMSVLALTTAAGSNMINGGISGSGTSAIDSTSAQTLKLSVIANVGGITAYGATMEYL